MVFCAIPADPQVTLMVDGEPMLILGPVDPRLRPSPSLDEVAFRIKFQHRRCRRAAVRLGRVHGGISFVVLQHSWTLKQPHVVLCINRHASDLPKYPGVVGQVRPKRIDLKRRHLRTRLRPLDCRNRLIT